MMKQYLRTKAEHPNAIVFFHLGDFYEAFFEDAETISRELDLVLTSRNGNPMAGVPVRRGESYVNQLLKRGYKVAICQQVEDPREATGLVKREVVRVATPGTTIDEDALEAGKNNYLCAVLAEKGCIGLASLDLSTGEFSCTSAGDGEELKGEISRLGPSELLLPDGWTEDLSGVVATDVLTPLPVGDFDAGNVEGSRLGVGEAALRAAGAILSYVRRTQKGDVSHVRALQVYSVGDAMELDPFTVRNLELIKTLREGRRQGSLLGVIDCTRTSMGRRLLRRSLLRPSTDRELIEKRLDAVEALVARDMVQQELQDSIKNVHDLERLIGRLGGQRMGPLDLLALQRSLEQVPKIGRLLHEEFSERGTILAEVGDTLIDDGLRAVIEGIAGMLVDQPPSDPRDGGLITTGYNDELDDLRDDLRAERSRIAALEQSERNSTGISSLKVGFNRVFGYYLEVTKPHLDKIPDRYKRRQTLANAERFITDELKAHEEKVTLGEERAKALEVDLFQRALDRLGEYIPFLQRIGDALARLDVLLSMAIVAGKNGYVRPEFTEKHTLSIRGGRHPVVEQVEEFVPNDLVLKEGKELVILTGPNMSGKSVYLRQAALICLMAQIGSFVPAKEATLPVIDRIFARVGASDMLVEGLSTFMMEMLETAKILDRATPRSLVILDEMGRGTSTFDGVSIAWAVAHELAVRTKAKTLFATHYQELTRLADELPAVVNLHVAVREVGNDVVFLHRVEPGVAEGSYGVYVARLAGVPDRVTERADQILSELLEEAPLSELGRKTQKAEALSLFGSGDHPVLKALQQVDTDSMTPLQALELIAKLRDRLQ